MPCRADHLAKTWYWMQEEVSPTNHNRDLLLFCAALMRGEEAQAAFLASGMGEGGDFLSGGGAHGG